jgi:hypothetical protein
VKLNIKDRMAGIAANLDDLQSGLEACSRAADALHNESKRVDGILKHIKSAPLIGSLVRHAADLLACARDQREALRELRDGIGRLQQELKRTNGAAKPPPGVHVPPINLRGRRSGRGALEA